MKIPEFIRSPIFHVSAAIIGGLSIVSLSAVANPGYGPIEGNLIIALGATMFSVLLAYVNAGYDAGLIADGKRINHIKRFIIRAIAALIFSFACFRADLINVGLLTVYQGALFWLFFDIFLSLKRNRKWNYISNWYGTSKLDLLFKGHWIPWLLTKIIILLGSLYILT